LHSFPTRRSSDLTAAAGSDYEGITNHNVTIPANATSVLVPVTILGDAVAEPNESFSATISISNINGQQVTIYQPTAIATIENDRSEERRVGKECRYRWTRGE